MTHARRMTCEAADALLARAARDALVSLLLVDGSGSAHHIDRILIRTMWRAPPRGQYTNFDAGQPD
jgi:hypothetical protein